MSNTKTRSNLKDNPPTGKRRRAAWLGLPCYVCHLGMYWGKNRTGRYADDMTIGHGLAHSNGGDYSPENTYPCCSACNDAMGTRNLIAEGLVTCGPAFPSIGNAESILARLEQSVTLRDKRYRAHADDAPERARRAAARQARGFTF